MALQLLARWTETVFDAVGDRNPQLLREWQGRLRTQNVVLTLVGAIAAQALVLLKGFGSLPSPANNSISSRYCLPAATEPSLDFPTCQLGDNGQFLMDWPLVFAEVFRDLSVVLVWGLIVIGVYLLAADISKESRRGTLTFLRMSPQSSRRILLGKLLGVPVLLYLACGVMLPLHFALGWLATYPPGLLLGFYGLLGAIAFCLYAAVLWLSLLTPGQGIQAALSSILAAVLLGAGQLGYGSGTTTDWPKLFNPLQALNLWKVESWGDRTTWLLGDYSSLSGLGWFLLPIGKSAALYLAFASVHALLLGAWFWVALERKFQTPSRAPLGKAQSYGLTLCLSLLMAGFALQSSQSLQWWSYSISMLICAVILMFLLLPSRQAVLDWARYRHQQPRGQRGLLQELWSHDDSPMVLALGCNLAIMAGVFLGGIQVAKASNGNVLTEARGTMLLLLGWLFAAAFMLLCATVVQRMALRDRPHERWLTFGVAVGLLLGWPLVLQLVASLDAYPSPWQELWLITAFAQTVSWEMGFGEVGRAIAGHLILLTGTNTLLAKHIQHLGQSEWKALVASSPRKP